MSLSLTRGNEMSEQSITQHMQAVPQFPRCSSTCPRCCQAQSCDVHDAVVVVVSHDLFPLALCVRFLVPSCASRLVRGCRQSWVWYRQRRVRRERRPYRRRGSGEVGMWIVVLGGVGCVIVGGAWRRSETLLDRRYTLFVLAWKSGLDRRGEARGRGGSRVCWLLHFLAVYSARHSRDCRACFQRSCQAGLESSAAWPAPLPTLVLRVWRLMSRRHRCLVAACEPHWTRQMNLHRQSSFADRQRASCASACLQCVTGPLPGSGLQTGRTTMTSW